MLRILPYQADHREACLEVFRSNVPEAFHPEEEEPFLNFLDHQVELCPDFDILLKEKQLIGFGGFAWEGKEARLIWGVVHKSHHGRGYGKRLLEHRLERIRKVRPDATITLETVPATEEFFRKFGFRTASIEKGHYPGGIDKVEMTCSYPPK